MSDTIQNLTGWPYVYRGKGPRKGARCRISRRDMRIGVVVEFTDGFRMIASQFAVRRFHSP